MVVPLIRASNIGIRIGNISGIGTALSVSIGLLKYVGMYGQTP